MMSILALWPMRPPTGAPFAEFAWILPMFGIVLLVLIRKQLFPGL